METKYIIIALSVCLVLTIIYILYINLKDKISFNSKEEKKVRFNDNNIDAMSFLEPNYEQRRIEEMKYEMM